MTWNGMWRQFATHPGNDRRLGYIPDLLSHSNRQHRSSPKLFGSVLVPQAVLAELRHEDAPEAVRDWAANLPTWITVQEDPRGAATGVAIGLEKLQAGEKAAILLAESATVDVILLDEKSARRVAAARGLRVAGTLAILGDASLRGLVDLATAIDRLRKTSFRYSPALLKATLDRFFHPQL